MEQLTSLLYSLSNAFLLPTLGSVLALFVATTYLVGQCLSEALDRRANRASLVRCERDGGGVAAYLEADWRGVYRRLAEVVRSEGPDSAKVDRELADLENGARARLERLSILIRTGPILGLIGTLIPLQPALAGLAAGDMQEMAANLLIGFTTTVIGLLVGGTSFVVAVFVRIWAREDLAEIRFLVAQWRDGLEATDETATQDEPYEEHRLEHVG